MLNYENMLAIVLILCLLVFHCDATNKKSVMNENKLLSSIIFIEFLNIN